MIWLSNKSSVFIARLRQCILHLRAQVLNSGEILRLEGPYRAALNPERPVGARRQNIVIFSNYAHTRVRFTANAYVPSIAIPGRLVLPFESRFVSVVT